MGKFKVYAVLKGRQTGVFHTWPECKAQTDGFEGPIFKGFMSEEEALAWLEKGGTGKYGTRGANATRVATKAKKEAPIDPKNFKPEIYFKEDHLNTDVLPPIMPETYAFVDGSYNGNYNGKAVYGYGGIVHINGEEVYVSGNGCEEEYVVSRQIPGEVFGSLTAIEKAIELGAEHIVVFYDYNGIGHWATTTEKRWKAEKPIAKAYVKRFDELNKKIKVNFYHVKAHTDIEGNELVDRMAKKEVGLL